jgi:hypothetical protein
MYTDKGFAETCPFCVAANERSEKASSPMDEREREREGERGEREPTEALKRERQEVALRGGRETEVLLEGS